MSLKLARLWLGPLPKEEIFPEKKPNFFVHWLAHPFKRRLAKYYLKVLQKIFGLKVIAITGSVGKTTTKDMLYAILSSAAPTVATTANITPTYNIPTTILRCSPRTKYLILEMGIEYKGDMDFYNWLAHPDIAVITAVNLSHTSFLDNLKTVAREKGKIAQFAKYLVIPESSENIEINTSGQVVKVSVKNYPLPASLIGSHFNVNASLAVRVAELLKVPSVHYSKLAHFPAPKHRMELVNLRSGSFLIDDTYNASPLAVKEALKALFETAEKLKKNPVIVFGQMNELGDYEKSAHEEIGTLLRRYKSKAENLELFATGPATRDTVASAGFGRYFDNQDELLEAVKPFAQSVSQLILLKGSRSWHLDELVEKLKIYFGVR